MRRMEEEERGEGEEGKMGERRKKMHSPPKREKVERSEENINKYM